ncbi:MAG: Two-component transcriptional response regulator, LuxR family, partial [uncultured Solirubrobacteraceae bacterium]
VQAHRPRPVERGDRRRARRLGDHGEDARRAVADEARPARPRAGRRAGVRVGRGAARRRL